MPPPADAPAPSARALPGAPGKGRLAERIPLALAVLLALVHLATVGPGWGSGFGDDYAMYASHARNLAEGRPYADVGFLFNPHNPWFSPRSYPPGFPLLLAPVYAAFGLDAAAMKVPVVLALGGVLLLLAHGARRGLHPAAASAAVLVLGLHPYLWRFRENVLPDLPFTFLCLAALPPMARAADPELPARRRLLWGLAASAAVAAAVATRTIGVVLVPAFAAALVLRSRRPGRALLAAGGALALLAAVPVLLLPSGEGYVQQVRDLVSVYGPSILVPSAGRVERAGYALETIWSNGHSQAAAAAVAAGTALLAAAGLLPRLRAASPAALFFAAYLLAALLWPAVNARYLVPVLPLYVLYAAAGAERAARGGGRWGRAAAAAAAVAVAATFAGAYAGRPAADGSAGIGRAALELYRHVAAHTRPDDRFLAERPRALALYTGREAAPAAPRVDDSTQLAFVDEAGIDYVVVRRGPDHLGGLVARSPARFVPVYRNRRYTLFRVRPAGGVPRSTM